MSTTSPNEEPGRKRPRRRTQPRQAKKDQRTAKVGVRLSEAEMQQLTAQARGQKRTRADVLRAAWLELPPPHNVLPEVLVPPVPPRVLLVDELAAYKLTVGLANNLNQLTRQAHLQQDVRAQALVLFTDLRQQLALWVPPYVKRDAAKIEQNQAS